MLVNESFATGTASANSFGSRSQIIGNNDGELGHILGRIRAANAELAGLAAKLSDHADRLRGEFPPKSEDAHGVPVRCGVLGEVQDSLDSMFSTISYLREQAERNLGMA